jgi:hypothetical protein
MSANNLLHKTAGCVADKGIPIGYILNANGLGGNKDNFKLIQPNLYV